jgi:hypothetical protein
VPGETLTPSEVSDFVVRIFQDAFYDCGRLNMIAAALSYPKADIRALASARSLLEAMCERRRGRNVDFLQAGISAIAEIRATAKADGDRVGVVVSMTAATRLRACMPYFIEYEVLWEKDRNDTGKRRWK